MSSTNNLYTIGNGGTIYTGPSYVPPTATTGQLFPGAGQAPNQPQQISKLYLQSLYTSE